MYRKVIEQLFEWKNDEDRKPLILEGARQVGKTWVLKEELGKSYEDIAEFNFERDSKLKDIFKDDLNTERIIIALTSYLGRPINKKTTLIIFDEIQESPRTLTALKYFCEDNNDYHIACAGSLLGVKLGRSSFPVGKVNTIKMYPMDFKEFLLAMNEKPLVDILDSADTKMIDTLSFKFEGLLKQYFYVGGMPEVVKNYVKNKDIFKVQTIQGNIISNYKNDIAKHAGSSIASKAIDIYNSLPEQLAKTNKRFIYSDIRDVQARSRNYKEPLLWLENAGLVHRLFNVKSIGIPLTAYYETGVFKLYLNDIGLLCRLSNIEFQTILQSSDLFTDFKGSLAEQYVFQELITKNKFDLAYWLTVKSTSEVDFIIYYKNEVFPLEVKSSTNKRAKSLASYIKTYNPKLSFRTSLRKFNDNNGLIDIPLFAISLIDRVIDDKEYNDNDMRFSKKFNGENDE